jgi:hypothetical protein
MLEIARGMAAKLKTLIRGHGLLMSCSPSNACGTTGHSPGCSHRDRLFSKSQCWTHAHFLILLSFWLPKYFSLWVDPDL